MQESQFAQYLAVLMLLVLAVAAPFGMIALSTLLGKRGQRNPTKDTAYECGMIPVGSGSPRMSVKFYLVAMLFILFDVEVVFLYPLAVIYRDMMADPVLRNPIFFGTLFFIGILCVGELYAIKKRAFDWKA